jgi:transglutaminase/protease-like cytokinesis protein 3
MRMKRIIISMAFLLSVLLYSPQSVLAADFDPSFYAGRYPDVVAVLGNSTDALYNHYLTYGMKERRLPYAGATPGEIVNGVKAGSASAVELTANHTGFVPVPINKLANYKSIKKKMSDDEFQQAYSVALAIVTPLAGKSREEQLAGIAVALRSRCDNGLVYSTSNAHYNDPYGYFVLGTASCAGCATATGLCLNILGIPCEHVNENQWSHQWCRVNVNGTYWICDAFGLCCEPEPSPYSHPLMQ